MNSDDLREEEEWQRRRLAERTTPSRIRSRNRSFRCWSGASLAGTVMREPTGVKPSERKYGNYAQKLSECLKRGNVAVSLVGEMGERE